MELKLTVISHCQIASFGVTAFALLFDDIEPEIGEADKEVFQTFAQAQVSVTNEVYQALGQPKFVLCPTGENQRRANKGETGDVRAGSASFEAKRLGATLSQVKTRKKNKISME